ncbi:type VI secretion system-associated protein TagF [Afifella marina]|uniref:Type VI secretion system protein ImpM n=1 Tax=Afifella marina DSM 2698 TaxID=1120955 RepID=A0A1G5MPG2_AFIMA|nr:type VI secretion system-associated protein TagF [Afifella marina]MBK1623976.1 type VI secretion system-associated protein TagF [Afifella marina DSM 2698]MBK1627108.1 type VI secretion system-associated protein TagF [Afifella marina]MBK5918863.1 type VI secretion-associated protein [Afifella marina]RAI22533.1 type VI secretion-associated protein [Afifella marina DSM 2698]SCZ26449.1 type VI secretion system protein ImpM [Afifella marina DSM 2698]
MIGRRGRRAEQPVEAAHPGFFGKVPTHGDFVSADLDSRFLEAFSAWLQQGLVASRQALGDAWRDSFLAAPPWRFTLTAGLCGPHGMAGVLLPSRDRIGRCFPLIAAARLDTATDPQRVAEDRTWFTALEAMAETALQPDFDLIIFRDKLRRLRPPIAVGHGSPPLVSISEWWTERGPHDWPIGFTAEGLPTPAAFLNLLSPSPPLAPNQSTPLEHVWRPRSLQTSVGQGPPPAADEPDEALEQQRVANSGKISSELNPIEAVGPPLRLVSALGEHSGLRAPLHADAAVQRDHPSILAVIDGIGHDGAALRAAQAVARALNEVPQHERLEQLVADIKGKLGRVHALIRAAQPRQGGVAAPDSASGGASVVLLAQAAGRFTVLWSGDARCYLLRDGMMRGLTRDHVEVGIRRRLSRSVGGLETSVLLDAFSDGLQPHDRFLLCSAPLVRALPERAIAEILLREERPRAVDLLVQDALLAQVSDNVTAIVIDAEPT